MTTGDRLGLYPDIEPYNTGFLRVSDTHEIYFEECGTPDGKPVVLLHGGPGGGSTPKMRCFHDPQRYRIILFDQRGCGRSLPHACLKDNTTWHLVNDMERLREHLGVERWQLFGGSWGSSLALAYAQKHPERVTDFILRGIFLLRRAELQWFYQDGASWLYPDAFECYQKPIPPDERKDMIAAYYKRLTGKDPAVQLEAARAWSIWEGTTLSLLADPTLLDKFSVDDYALTFARIESHYFVHGGFFERDGQLLEDVWKISHLPCIIVQGRYDVVTPLKSAWELAKAWPKAELHIVPDAGHAMTEPGIVHELVSATRRFAE